MPENLPPGSGREYISRETANRAKMAAFRQVCWDHRLGLVYFFGSRTREAMELLGGKRLAIADPLTDVDVGVVTLEPLPAGRT